jgi:hypothetical protein
VTSRNDIDNALSWPRAGSPIFVTSRIFIAASHDVVQVYRGERGGLTADVYTKGDKFDCQRQLIGPVSFLYHTAN